MELALLKTGGGVDTSELTATENDVVSPYTFYGKDDEEKDTGGVTNKGKKTHTLAANGTYAVEEGYYESITVNQSLATYALSLIHILSFGQLCQGTAEDEHTGVLGCSGEMAVQRAGGHRRRNVQAENIPQTGRWPSDKEDHP